MRILPINNTDRQGTVQFKRKPTAKEFQYYTASVSEGLKVLNKELGFIVHNQSVPSRVGANIGIGSLLSKFSKEVFTPFLVSHGFKKIQQEPNYVRRITDPSPYDPISTAKNIYMIPLEKLASDEYGMLLSKSTLDNIIKRKEAENNSNRVNYKNIDKEYNLALNEAYTRFKMRQSSNLVDSTYLYMSEKNKSLNKSLINDFEKFKAIKEEELEAPAFYEILTRLYQEEDWTAWDEVDRNLFNDKNYAWRIDEIRRMYSEEIDFFMFKQWLAEREIGKTNSHNKKLGINIVADTPIAFSPAEQWANQDLFLEELVLGCPPDYYSKNGQRWDFAILDPKKVFNPDGSLGKGGEFLKKRYEAIFESSPGGVRIDHLIGLIDPFVYKKSESKMNDFNSGRLYSSPHIDILKDYTKFTEAEFTAIFDKIIFPAAEKFGITRDNIICEDLGYITDNVKKVIQKLDLTGMSLTQFGYSGYDAPARNMIMLGGHDNKSYIEYTDEIFTQAQNLGQGRDRFMFRTHILGSDTAVPNEDVNQYRENIRSDKSKFIGASFAELFTSPAKKVQIFFTDFFGIGKTYNVPGTKEGCWELRTPENFEDLYYENLKKGTAFNAPEAIARAIRQKGTDFSNQHTKLLRKLDYFARILKD